MEESAQQCEPCPLFRTARRAGCAGATSEVDFLRSRAAGADIQEIVNLRKLALMLLAFLAGTLG
jgi:hypothetical protein